MYQLWQRKITHSTRGREASERDTSLDEEAEIRTNWSLCIENVLWKTFLAAAVNSHVFPISSGVKRKAMNT